MTGRALPSTEPQSHTLSEASSKAFLAPFGIPFLAEQIVATPEEAAAAAAAMGFPVVLKANGEGIADKTERGLVRLALADADAVTRAADELMTATAGDEGEVSLLVAPMVSAHREFLAGLARDPQFGMTVVMGAGGVLAEAVGDVTVRLVPIEAVDADEMLEDLTIGALLGPWRGEPAVDRAALADVLLGLSRAASEHLELVSVDLNPILIQEGRPVAVDALVELGGAREEP